MSSISVPGCPDHLEWGPLSSAPPDSSGFVPHSSGIPGFFFVFPNINQKPQKLLRWQTRGLATYRQEQELSVVVLEISCAREQRHDPLLIEGTPTGSNTS